MYKKSSDLLKIKKKEKKKIDLIKTNYSIRQ